MTDTLVQALSSLMSLKRWNLLPQIEIWTEAENIAFYSHITYAIAKNASLLNDEECEHLLTRCLLKSFNKYSLSDVSIGSRDQLKKIDTNVWERLVDETAKEAAKLFPRQVAKDFQPYLEFKGSYQNIKYKLPKERKELIENLIKFCQYKVAEEECKYNKSVFSIDRYSEITKDLFRKIREIPDNELFEETFKDLKDYIDTVRNLKYVRRWNRLNRSVESTVLGHTYVVSLLARISHK